MQPAAAAPARTVWGPRLNSIREHVAEEMGMTLELQRKWDKAD